MFPTSYYYPFPLTCLLTLSGSSKGPGGRGGGGVTLPALGYNGLDDYTSLWYEASTVVMGSELNFLLGWFGEGDY